ncbi:MAG: Fe-S cluster assembly protein SufD, partial [Bacteroidetes bacterium]|nr:Fe-S cluster assembly protein SufD [Bacteroidota bacterium]
METVLKDKISELFVKNKYKIFNNDPAEVKAIRERAFADFLNQDFPTIKWEAWKNTDLKKVLAKEYSFYFEPVREEIDIENVFRCEVPDFDTHIISLYNGWYVYRDKPITILPDGTIVGSFARAMTEYPEIILKHYNQYARENNNGLNSLNTACAQDGIFIYVPDGVATYKTIQMVNILNREDNVFVQNRNLVIVGKNSRLTLVHCDDSHNHKSSFTNTITEVFMDEGAKVEHYKLQNLNNDTSLISSTFFNQSANSDLVSFAISLNGGLIRNDIRVKLNGEGSTADINGLYLVDKEQHVDNQIFVDHAKSYCTSNELFKGILDDQSTAVFNGHILVRKDSQKTNAYQKNRNVLLTDKASVNAKPFLEI